MHVLIGSFILIGIVSEFNYLGVLLSKSGNFSMAKKAQVEKATKAMFEILKRGKIHNLSIQCQLDLFDKIIKPILLYGCEVWGFSKNEIIERVHYYLILKLPHQVTWFMGN
jgi:hypothetical protein